MCTKIIQHHSLVNQNSIFHKATIGNEVLEKQLKAIQAQLEESKANEKKIFESLAAIQKSLKILTGKFH